MSFISYAQNFEDVMLWRALKHIQCGFYIDIGAWSPDIDSVTRAFYERGWSGINVEPNPEFNSQLQERRPRDQNLRLAVGDHEGSLTMNFLGNPGLSTLDDAIANQHQKAGWSLDRQEVQVTTLATLWGQHVPIGQDVHFLKVNVEGLEEAVLRGNDWTKGRPWVVVVEATLPMSQVESHEVWEPVLFAADYLFAFADGLNRFYVASERAGLLPAFKYPPNVFDDFILSSRQQAEAQAQQSETRAQQAEAKAQQAEAMAHQEAVRVDQAESRAQQSETHAQPAEVRASEQEQRAVAAEGLAGHYQQQANEWHERVLALYNSPSWQITKPLRALGRIVRRQSMVGEPSSVSTSQLRQFVRARVVSAIKWAGDRARRSPGFKRFALRLLRGHPSLHKKLLRVYLENQFKDQPRSAIWPGTSTDVVMPQPTPSGINANQRTPLESSFHTYRDQP